MKKTIDIRVAQPTVDDAMAFAELGNMASHDLMVDMLGKHYQQVLVKMFLRDDNLFGYPYSHFAIVEGKRAGLLYGYSYQQKVLLENPTTQVFIRSVGLKSPRVLWIRHRLGVLFKFMETLPPNAYYLQAIAVYPQFRGQGVSKCLLGAADDLAQQAQMQTLELDTETNNTVAINAYQGHGMKITETSSVIYHRMQSREIGLYRMVKKLP